MRAARLWIGALALGLAACGADPPCVDDEGEELPFCEVKVQGVDDPLVYCPGEHWGAEDGCNSCGCDGGGEVVCTTLTTCAE